MRMVLKNMRYALMAYSLAVSTAISPAFAECPTNPEVATYEIGQAIDACKARHPGLDLCGIADLARRLNNQSAFSIKTFEQICDLQYWETRAYRSWYNCKVNTMGQYMGCYQSKIPVSARWHVRAQN